MDIENEEIAYLTENLRRTQFPYFDINLEKSIYAIKDQLAKYITACVIVKTPVKVFTKGPIEKAVDDVIAERLIPKLMQEFNKQLKEDAHSGVMKTCKSKGQPLLMINTHIILGYRAGFSDTRIFPKQHYLIKHKFFNKEDESSKLIEMCHDFYNNTTKDFADKYFVNEIKKKYEKVIALDGCNEFSTNFFKLDNNKLNADNLKKLEEKCLLVSNYTDPNTCENYYTISYLLDTNDIDKKLVADLYRKNYPDKENYYDGNDWVINNKQMFFSNELKERPMLTIILHGKNFSNYEIFSMMIELNREQSENDKDIRFNNMQNFLKYPIIEKIIDTSMKLANEYEKDKFMPICDEIRKRNEYIMSQYKKEPEDLGDDYFEVTIER